MATADDWRRVRAALMSASNPMRSPHLDQLYRLAREDGLRRLRSFRQIDAHDHQDVVHDALMKALRSILEPSTTNPRGYFFTVLERAAIDVLRKRRKSGSSVDIDHLAPDSGSATRPDERSQVIDRQALLDAESPKNQQVLVAVGLGESREAIAKAMGTTRANVDQIVSRFRKRARRTES